MITPDDLDDVMEESDSLLDEILKMNLENYQKDTILTVFANCTCLFFKADGASKKTFLTLMSKLWSHE